MSAAPSGELRRLATRGVAWATAGQGATVALHYVVTLLLAWRLTPGEFGVVGLATIYVFPLTAATELGLGAALVQRRELTAGHVAAAFWLSLATGLALGAGLWLAAGPVALLMREPRLAPVLRPLALMIPAHALLVVPRALLQRALAFRRLAATEVGAEAALAAVALALAVRGWGVWSLVAGLVARHVVRATLLWWARPWRPGGFPALADCADVLRFGGLVLGSMLATQVMSNVDYFVVGRWLGATALAHYTLAFQLAIIPVQRVCEVLSRVAFPSFARIQADGARLRRALAEMLEGPTAAVAAGAVVLALAAPALIRALYGDAWLPAAPLLRLLALAAPFYVLDSAQAVLRATGRPGVDLGLDALRVAVFAVLVVAGGLAAGAVDVARSLLVASALAGTAKLVVARRSVGLRAFAEAIALAAVPALLLGVAPGVRAMPAVALAAGAAGGLAARAAFAARGHLAGTLRVRAASPVPRLAGS
jgi:PST family polysaccharide transporter